jgi:hypothetical protein
MRGSDCGESYPVSFSEFFKIRANQGERLVKKRHRFILK